MLELSETRFTSIAGEGNDGSGKNTAVLTILEHVVENEDSDVILTNFPQYFLPSGFLVRSMLRGAGDEYIEMMDATPEQELNLRMAMFQLDRIVAWGILENYRNSHENVLHVSDRLGMSQVNTWAFLVAKYKGKMSEEEAESLLKLALKSDEELYKRLKPQTIVFAAGQDNCGVNRVELDQYERKDAVARAEAGYLTGIDFYNGNDRPAALVSTKDPDGAWRDRHEIAGEALKSAGLSLSNISEKTFDLYEAVKSGSLLLLDL
jgi:thymidylate kinase